jgi:hypothetical protein
MNIDKSNLPDNGGRRTEDDRRKFVYTSHLPERRDDIERRSGIDRRKSLRIDPLQEKTFTHYI